MSELVHIKGLADLQQLLDTLPAKLEANVMRGALRAGMKPIQADAKERVSVVSGALQSGLKISTRIAKGQVVARLRSTGKHAFLAHMLEFTGAQAHDIKPKKRKSLFIAGVYREIVRHPGFKARPFMRPALDGRAQDAVIATGVYIKRRLATKEGLDTADIDVGVES